MQNDIIVYMCPQTKISSEQSLQSEREARRVFPDNYISRFQKRVKSKERKSKYWSGKFLISQ